MAITTTVAVLKGTIINSVVIVATSIIHIIIATDEVVVINSIIGETKLTLKTVCQAIFYLKKKCKGIFLTWNLTKLAYCGLAVL
jgi:hypothetical protein